MREGLGEGARGRPVPLPGPLPQGEGEKFVTLTILLQVAVGGLLMGLIYALVAAGLSLIFGLMDVVNFAHGELLMLAMYATSLSGW